MAKCTINTFPAASEPGSTETHYGLACIVGEKRELIADVPDEFLEAYLAAGRVTLLEGEDEFANMSRDARKGYLTAHGVDFPKNISDVNLLALCRKTKAEQE